MSKLTGSVGSCTYTVVKAQPAISSAVSMSDAGDDAAAAPPDYMGDISALLPPDDSQKPYKRPKLKPYSNLNPDPKPKPRSSLSWQQRRRLERERQQMEEDKLTASALATATIPSSNIGFKLLSRMGYNPDDKTAKEPVAPEIRRTRAGIGAEYPAVAAARMEKEREEKKRRREEEMEREFGEKQKLEWRYRRVVADFHKAEAVLAQLEKRELVPQKKKDDEEEKDDEDEEETITEEVNFQLSVEFNSWRMFFLI